MADRALLCVFAKPPVPGRAKTRLATTLGDTVAAELARAFLHDTWAGVSALDWASLVLATTDGTAPEFGLPGQPRIWFQGEGDLGRRIERIVERGLAEADLVIAVGADSPGLPPSLIEEAREQLAAKDAVLGPADDGGLYLIGVRRCPPALFDRLPWGSSATFAAMKQRLHAFGMSVGVLPPWFDVDLPQDLDRLRACILRGEVQAPATSQVLARFAQAPPMRLSVIIPVLDEEARIGGQLAALRALRGLHEVIVVDGGSSDRTLDAARAHEGVTAVAGPRGRGAQMNAGASLATGDVLLFLHADVRLPEDAHRWIGAALAEHEVVAGAFRTWTVPDGQRTWLGPLLHLADLRSRYTRHPYGDQAIFVRAETFRLVGGFPDQPIMEDLELSRRLRRLGRIRTVPARVRVSGRRFLARPFHSVLASNLLPLLYRLGVPPRALADLYGNPR